MARSAAPTSRADTGSTHVQPSRRSTSSGAASSGRAAARLTSACATNQARSVRGTSMSFVYHRPALLSRGSRQLPRARAVYSFSPWHLLVAAGSVDCKKDTDCVAVVDDCCPCSEGGKQRAIPKKDQAGYEKDRRKRCEGTACTEVMSQDATCEQ